MSQNSILKKENIWYIIAFIMAMHMYNFPFVVYTHLVDKGPSWYGLDPSWQITLNYAVLKDWVWGNDIIYTYGPLGFLSTRFGLGISRWIFVLFDLFLIVNFFYLFKSYIKEAPDKVIATGILFLITLLLGTHYDTGLGWIITLFIFHWLYQSYKNPRLIYFAVLSILITVSFFIKVNVGLFGLIFLSMHVVNMLIFKRIKILPAIFAIAMPIGLILLSASLLHVSILNYLKGSVEIIKGYTDIMFLNQDNETAELNVNILYYSIGFLLLLYTVSIIKRKQYSQLLYVGFSVVYIFLLRKQAILRNDIQHLSEFLPYAPIVLIYGNLVSFPKFPRFTLVYTALIVIMALGNGSHSSDLNQRFLNRYTNQFEYRKQHKAYNLSPFLHQKDMRFIPNHILAQIGNRSIDVFPWDAAYLIENHLNYTPRPVFQSFCAFTAYLQDINYKCYLDSPPEFIIYDYETIDSRHPFNDEIFVNSFIARNYILKDTFTSNERLRLFLQRKTNTTPLSIEKSHEKTAEIGQDILTDSVSMMKVSISYNLRGKLESIYNKPPMITLMTHLYNKGYGHWLSYKTGRELLKTGILVDRTMTTTLDFATYITNKDSLDRITTIKIQVDSMKYFNKDLKVEFYNID